MKRPKVQSAQRGAGIGLRTLPCALCTVLGCITVRPEDTGHWPVPHELAGTDPRVRVARVADGQAAPFAGVLLNEWTWERVLEGLRGAQGRMQSAGPSQGERWAGPGGPAEGGR